MDVVSSLLKDNASLCRKYEVRLKTPNPLFEKWLEEWRVEAAVKNLPVENSFRMALVSLRKFPLTLKSGRQCKILENFGPKLCLKLDEKLSEYRKRYPNGEIVKRPKSPEIVLKLKNKNSRKAKSPKKLSRADYIAELIDWIGGNEEILKNNVKSTGEKSKVEVDFGSQNLSKPLPSVDPCIEIGAVTIPAPQRTAFPHLHSDINSGIQKKALETVDLTAGTTKLPPNEPIVIKDKPTHLYNFSGSSMDILRPISLIKGDERIHINTGEERRSVSFADDGSDEYAADTLSINEHSYPKIKINLKNRNSKKRKDLSPNTSSTYAVNSNRKKLSSVFDHSGQQRHPLSSISVGNASGRKDWVNHPYVPAKGTGAYAILIALHNNISVCGFGRYDAQMTKKDLKKQAQRFCEASFDRPLPGSRYTAWSAMGQLCKKQLTVKVNSHPARYYLTHKGAKLAEKLKNAATEVNSINESINLCDPTGSDDDNNDFILNVSAPSTSKQIDSLPLFEKIHPQITEALPVLRSRDEYINNVHTFSSSDDETDGFESTKLDEYKVSMTNGLSTVLNKIPRSIFNKSPKDKRILKIKKKPSCTIVRPLSEIDGDDNNVIQEVAKIPDLTSSKERLHLSQEDISTSSETNRKANNLACRKISDKNCGASDEKKLQEPMELSDHEEDIFGALTQKNLTKPPSPILSQKSSVASQSSSCSLPENIEMLANQYVPVLLIDTADTMGKIGVERIKDKLLDMNINCEVRHLNVGDYAWICRDFADNELMLPYIVERKRLDDFSKSIKDGRFHEQKFRLKSVPVKQRIYIVEGYGHGHTGGLPLSTLMQAASNTQLIDGFMVKFTKDYNHTLRYLATLTHKFSNLLNGKTLKSYHGDMLPQFSWSNNVLMLSTFKGFMKNANKKRKFTVREMFTRHLLQLHGISVEKATAIVEKYPCPRLLFEAYQNGSGDENLLTKIKVGRLQRSLGAVISKNIHNLYSKDQFS